MLCSVVSTAGRCCALQSVLQAVVVTAVSTAGWCFALQSVMQAVVVTAVGDLSRLGGCRKTIQVKNRFRIDVQQGYWLL